MTYNIYFVYHRHANYLGAPGHHPGRRKRGRRGKQPKARTHSLNPQTATGFLSARQSKQQPPNRKRLLLRADRAGREGHARNGREEGGKGRRERQMMPLCSLFIDVCFICSPIFKIMKQTSFVVGELVD